MLEARTVGKTLIILWEYSQRTPGPSQMFTHDAFMRQLLSFLLSEGIKQGRWFPSAVLPFIPSLFFLQQILNASHFCLLVSHLIFWRRRCSAALSSCGPLNYKYQAELTLLMPHRVLILPLSLSLPPSLSSWLSRLISHQVQLDRAPSSVCSLLSVLQFSEPSFHLFHF